MSGGGAFGAFQAGVIQTLKRHDIRISAYAGSSIGAINAILASSHKPNALTDFWLNIPDCIENEMEFAQTQWKACLLTLSRAKRIGEKAGYSHFQSLSLLEKGKKFLRHGLFIEAYDAESERFGQKAAHAHINATIDEIESKGPILSEKAAKYLRSTLTGHRLTNSVYATVSELTRFSAQHVVRIHKQKHSEVTQRGSYIHLDGSNTADIGLASASMPLVFGRKNNINSTEFLDGGLCDNLPAAALSDHIAGDELDCLLLIDVSRNTAAVKRDMIGCRIGRHTPIMYIGLSERSTGLKNLLNFTMADSLFRKGQRAGAKAVKLWFRDGFDPVSTFLDSSSPLPESHVIRVS